MGRGIDSAVEEVAQLRDWLLESPKSCENACFEARLVFCQFQHQAEAAALGCARPVPTTQESRFTWLDTNTTYFRNMVAELA